MEKVWFKLRQTDYPPEDEGGMGTGNETAPLCLGHFVSDLRRLDFVLNSGEIEAFPPGMDVYPTDTLHFNWNDSDESDTHGGLGAGAPIIAALGLVVKASVKTIFKRAVNHWEEYDRLDTYIFQPDKVYAADCLEGDKLSNYIDGKGSWSMFMITGIKVARKGKKTTSESNRREGDVGFEGDAFAGPSIQGNLMVGRTRVRRYGGDGMSDFVWAVRLAKIHKGWLMKDWSLDPHTSRATFGAGDEEVDVCRTVAGEGLETFHVVEDEELDEALVIDDDTNEYVETSGHQTAKNMTEELD
ncbi:hypothetical protein BHE90_010299 [Fusarium euwallaceae]|uniref:Uncharacterized protein n=1 Tax=Fusarium euwallaceae TaxID=1147111 RepID=A0A430LHR7_9HYPO|nr:hypothetical protein BHE90_010299 [Fusarium euwallaceae]